MEKQNKKNFFAHIINIKYMNGAKKYEYKHS